MSLSYDAINALTQKKYLPKLIDTFFTSKAFFAMLKERTEMWDGGPKIVQPLVYAGLSHVSSFYGYDTISYDTSLPFTAAEFSPKFVVAPFIISKTEEAQNQGPQQVINLVRAKFEVLQKQLVKDMTTQLYGNGSGNSGKDIDGLSAMIPSLTTWTGNTYGGISRETYSWWRPKTQDMSGKAITVPALTQFVVQQLTDGDDRPDMILSGTRSWTRYHDIVGGRVQIVTENVKKMQDLGFPTLEFMGIPWVFDPDINESSTGTIYFLNWKYIRLRTYTTMNFTMTPFRQSDNQIAMKREILWGGNLTCSNCAKQGKWFNVDVTGY